MGQAHTHMYLDAAQLDRQDLRPTFGQEGTYVVGTALLNVRRRRRRIRTGGRARKKGKGKTRRPKTICSAKA